ncbi:hypothetical protein MRX96_039938 [Rhipicephalus microplus]
MGYLKAVGIEDFTGHGKSVKMKPPKLPLLYLQVCLCCTREFTDARDTSLTINASGHRRLQRAVWLATIAIDYAPAHASGMATASAPQNENGAHRLLKAVGIEDFTGHGKSVKIKPPKLPFLYFQVLLCCTSEFTDARDSSLTINASGHRHFKRAFIASYERRLCTSACVWNVHGLHP